MSNTKAPPLLNALRKCAAKNSAEPLDDWFGINLIHNGDIGDMAITNPDHIREAKCLLDKIPGIDAPERSMSVLIVRSVLELSEKVKN